MFEEKRRPDGRGRPWRDGDDRVRPTHVENFVAMLQLGCMRILLNRL